MTRHKDMFDFLLDGMLEGFARDFTGEALPEVLTSDKAVAVVLDLPGVRKEDVQLSLDGRVLKVQAERKAHEVEGFERKLPGEKITRRYLIEGVDKEGVKASLKEGVLTIILPKLGSGSKTSIPVE